MLRSAMGKVMWAGKATVFMMGLALMLALIFGMASTALGANNDPFILGVLNNTATAITKLTGNVSGGPALQVVNNKTEPGSRGLQVTVAANKPPILVNATAGKATNLNADKLDGQEASSFANATHAHAGEDIASGTVEADRIEDWAGSNLNADQLDGKDSAAFATQAQMSAFTAAEVISSNGPLPVQNTYTSKGGTLLISASGSGFRAATPGLMGMHVIVDGVIWGSPRVFANEINSHKAFVDDYFVVTGLGDGQHTIRLEAIYSSACTGPQSNVLICTTTNEDDWFGVSVLEIPN